MKINDRRVQPKKCHLFLNTMNPNYKLLTSIIIGILLSGCTTPESIGPSPTPPSGAGATVDDPTKQTKRLPRYVKHNPHGIEYLAKVKPVEKPPFITVFFSNPDSCNMKYVIYQTTDKDGIPGDPHSRVNANESADSTLFKIMFPLDAKLELIEDDQEREVTIKVSTKCTCYAWKSDSGWYWYADQRDSDVKWTEEKCP